MNLKERGITVGDLLILLIIIFTTTILFKTIKKEKNTTLSQNVFEEITYGDNLTINTYSKIFSIL